MRWLAFPAMNRDQVMIDYDAAVQAERQAWLKVRGKHLGTRLHDAALWREWVAAAERMQQLSSQLKSLACSPGSNAPAP
jgi:hypothetical protein